MATNEQSVQVISDSQEQTPTRPPTSLVDIACIIQTQNDVLQKLLDSLNSGSKETLNVLRQMNDRQAVAESARHIVPEVPATSASAWSPLLKSYHQNIEAKVDGWRGTLDTLLIFVALFSAIVTSFLVQSLSGLTEDDGKRTHELLANLTEVVLALGAGTPASQLDLPQPDQFVPDRGAVRLNVYWSISLIFSISVASLTVTSRGHVALLTRSRHTQAHKKLGDLHSRWKQATRILGPVVETLPQLLILPVLLFIVGLLDNILSTALPLSAPLAPILAAGAISCVCVALVAVYIGFTLVHGGLYPTDSPYQTTLSQLIESYGRTVIGWFSQAYKTTTGFVTSTFVSWITIFRKRRPRESAIPLGHVEPPSRDVTSRGATTSGEFVRPDLTELSMYLSTFDPITVDDSEYEAFHTAVQSTHEDDSLDQAAAALAPLMFERQRVDIARVSGDTTEQEMQTVVYLLSAEASVRCNVTAASVVVKSFVSHYGLFYRSSDRNNLLPLLERAARRYSLAVSGNPLTSILWDSPFTAAMVMLLNQRTFPNTQQIDRTHGTTVLALLLSDMTNIDFLHPSQRHRPSQPSDLHLLISNILAYASGVLLAKIRDVNDAPNPSESAMDAAMDTVLKPSIPFFRTILDHSDEAWSSILMRGLSHLLTSLSSPNVWASPADGRALQAFLRWFIRKPGFFLVLIQAVERTLESMTAEMLKGGHNVSWFLGLLPHINRQLESHFKDTRDHGGTTPLTSGYSPHSMAQMCRSLLSICVKLVLLLQDLDTNSNPTQTWWLRILHDDSDPNSDWCNQLCWAHKDVIRTLETIHLGNTVANITTTATAGRLTPTSAPAGMGRSGTTSIHYGAPLPVSLEYATWYDLLAKLGVEESTANSYIYDTSMEHRMEVKQSLLHAFGEIFLRDRATGHPRNKHVVPLIRPHSNH